MKVQNGRGFVGEGLRGSWRGGVGAWGLAGGLRSYGVM